MNSIGRLRKHVMGFALACFSGNAFAGYGLTLASFGVESVGVAGADLATTNNSIAVNINPARLTQIQDSQFDAYLNPYYSMRTSHSDGFGNSEHRNDMPAGATFAASYAQRPTSFPKLVLGTGLFVQGGSGFEYEDLQTAFGTRDEINVNLGIIKVAVGAGWQVADRVSLGATLGLHIAAFRQQLFPNTSDANAGFFGARLDDGWDFAPNVKLGIQYQPTPTWTLAAAYSSRTDLDIHGGSLTVNYEALGLGRVKYQNASFDGLSLAQDFGVSAAWQANPRLRLALELNWLDWSQAMRATRVRADSPDSPGLPAALQTVDLSTPLEWKDQYAIAIGAEWQYDDKTVLRAGFDRATKTVPRRNLSPILNLNQNEEITAAISRKLTPQTELGMAVQYQFLQQVTYDNPNLPLGPQAREDYELLSVLLSVSRRW